jgi:hypothetical protein
MVDSRVGIIGSILNILKLCFSLGLYGVGRGGAFPSDDLNDGSGGGGGGPPNHYERGRGAGPPLLPPIYHMGTLSRASKAGGAGEHTTEHKCPAHL